MPSAKKAKTYCKSLGPNKLVTWLLITLICCYSHCLLAEKKVEGLRIWSAPENTRLVFDLSHPVKYKLFTLENPHRIVIDLNDVKSQTKFDKNLLRNSGISNLRFGVHDKGIRLVLDLQEKVKPSSFLLGPNQTYGHRLVVDLALTKTPLTTTLPAASLKKRVESKAHAGQFIVAIDPGHGGDDSGAIGRHHHLKEKDVVFAVSKKLQTLVNAQPGMKAFLVRTGDYYVGLRNRMELARAQGADLFISVHADSFNDPRVSGASVFVLSEKGASNEAARWLAEKENRADLIGGVKLEDKGDLLASVLLDLSQTASQNASHELANHLIANLSKVTDLHHKTVQRAGFLVLKSPDIPSVLVELGFISNKQGEKKLQAKTHQQALASALLSGIKAYAAKHGRQSQEWTIAKN
ncbi:MAG: N-acetylmuramoyl-L-alanine amidase [Proteobacteria bacterium]|nr:N-acetylmuramoyl-L-alanine amidase [Pseudomonadota bacterium]